ncbi:hypothetical protein C8R43DRAFT_919788 [Mycena crocata]|nr:hypothetical protein C8R43DRAFT_919788 [Mycena crocata]
MDPSLSMPTIRQVDPDKPLTKVDDLWFPKDTIVILAEHKIFQISGGVLAARSEVFSNMLAFPQPTSGDVESIEGTPVVRLHDSADDVEVFLRAIYDSSYFMPAPVPIELQSVLGILKLSHKYEVQYLHRRALEHLALDGWYSETYECYSNGGTDHLINLEPRSPINSLAVIVAATEVGALWLLPYAYYCTSTFGSEILLAITGALAQPVRKCIASHADLLRGQIAVNQFLRKRCLNPTCDAVFSSELCALLDDVAQSTFAIPLMDPKKTFKRKKKAGICKACYDLAKTTRLEAATAFWDRLPAIYGLPPWAELVAMKQAAMGEEPEDAMDEEDEDEESDSSSDSD